MTMPNTRLHGTWVEQQTSTDADLGVGGTSATYNRIIAALGFANVLGFSHRVTWAKIYGTGPDYPYLLEALDLVRKYNHDHGTNLLYVPRFMAGTNSPSAVTSNGAFTSTLENKALPLPFDRAGNVNTVFENALFAEFVSLAAWCRTNGVLIMHNPWYGGLWSEIYLGPAIVGGTQLGTTYPVSPQWAALGAPTGYNLWIAAHERIVDQVYALRGSDLTVEFPLSGWENYGHPASDLDAYLNTKFGTNTRQLFVQANNYDDSTPSAGDSWPNTYSAKQMVGMDNGSNSQPYNWTPVYSGLVSSSSDYLEIYAESFSSGTYGSGNINQLQAQITTFAGTAPTPHTLTPAVAFATNPKAGAYVVGQVGTFDDTTHRDLASTYSACIVWGDPNNTRSACTVSGSGPYVVSAPTGPNGFIYAAAGTYNATLVVTYNGTSTGQGGQAMAYQKPVSVVAGLVKNPPYGCFDRRAIPTSGGGTINGGSYALLINGQQTMGGWFPTSSSGQSGVAWSDLQTTASGAINANVPGGSTSGNGQANPIDQAITLCRQYNAAIATQSNGSGGTGPTDSLYMTIAVRLQLGFKGAPSWASGAFGSFIYTDPSPTSGASGNQPIWWTDNYIGWYADFLAKLSALYDAVPEISAVTFSGPMTAFVEPCIRGTAASGNGAQMIGAGYNVANFTSSSGWNSSTATGGYADLTRTATNFPNSDLGATKRMIDAQAAAFPTTCTLYPFNPFQYFTGTAAAPVGNTGTAQSEAMTAQLMNYFVAAMGPRAVVGNLSIRRLSSTNATTCQPAGGYAQVYSELISTASGNQPLWFQTASSQQIYSGTTGPTSTDLSTTLATCISWGAQMVELPGPPSGYYTSGASCYTSSSGVAAWTNSLKANMASGYGSQSGPQPLQQTALTMSASGTVCSGAITASSGSLYILHIFNHGAIGVASVTDAAAGGSNTWVRAGGDQGNAQNGEQWYVKGGKPPVRVTITFASGTAGVAIFEEWAAMDTTAPLDQFVASHGSGGVPPNSGSITTLLAQEIVTGFVGAINSGTTIAVTASGFTPSAERTSNVTSLVSNIMAAYRNTSAAGTFALSGTTTPGAAWVSCLGSYAVAGSVPNPHTLTTPAVSLGKVTAGVAYTGTVATFDDSTSRQASTQYSASILWGDGSSDTGLISGSGPYTVRTPASGHTYAKPGTYSVSVAAAFLGAGAGKASGSASVTVGTPPPTLNSINPNTGPASGGTQVSVAGQWFKVGGSVTNVTLGSTAVATLSSGLASGTAYSSLPVAALANPIPGGALLLIDPTSNGASAPGPGNQTTGASVTELVQVLSTGANAGDTSISIAARTTLFAHASGATLAITNPASGVSTNSDSAVIFTTPPLPAATYNTFVTTKNGTSYAGGSQDDFTFTPVLTPPVVTSIVPASGAASGGTTVAIGGSGFTAASAVTFDVTPARSFVLNSDSSITAVSPSHIDAQVYVTVSTPLGTSEQGTPSLYTYGTGGSGFVSPVALQTVTGTVLNASGGGIPNALVTIVLTEAAVVPFITTVVQTPIIVETDASGNYTAALVSNLDLSPNDSLYSVTENALAVGGGIPVTFTVQVPNTGGPFVMRNLIH